MFVGTVTNWTSVVGTDIPFVSEMNSNNKISNLNGSIELKRGGYWKVDASIILQSATTGDYTVTLYVDGVAKATTQAIGTIGEANEFVTLPIVDGIKTELNANPDFANISLRVDTAGAIVNGKIVVEYVQ